MEFNKKFNSFYPVLISIAKRYSRSTAIPFEEYESSLCEEFYLKYESFDSDRRDNFNAFMRVVLTQRATRLANRREREFYDNVEFYEASTFDEDGEEQEFDIPSDFDLEDHVIKKTDEDKRQLIQALAGKADSITQKIVNEFLKGEHASPTAIGRALGVHHQVIARKLTYLSRNFNENEFGEIDSYLVS